MSCRYKDLRCLDLLVTLQRGHLPGQFLKGERTLIVGLLDVRRWTRSDTVWIFGPGPGQMQCTHYRSLPYPPLDGQPRGDGAQDGGHGPHGSEQQDGDIVR